MTAPATTVEAFVRQASTTAREILATGTDCDGTANDVVQTAVCLTVCAWLQHTSAGTFAPVQATGLNQQGRSRLADFAAWLNRTSVPELLADFQRKQPGGQFGLHFFELFLQAFAPQERLKRGVFFTPAPVAQFIVDRVDTSLRDELGLARGLADLASWANMTARLHRPLPTGVAAEWPFVQIFDPALGTGTFLIAAVDRAWRTFAESYAGNELQSQWNAFVPSLVKRMTGFELMPAPLAIARTQLLLKLAETGYTFDTSLQWSLFQTNSLEPSDASGTTLAHVKRALVPTVILGNPPYKVSSQNQNPWIEELCQPIKHAVLHEKNRQPLNDDYVKFFALARHYALRSGLATLGFITNRSYLDGMLYRGLREKLLELFPRQSIIDLGGDTRDGSAGDQNVFDITQGVAAIVGSPVSHVVSYERWHGTRGEKVTRLEEPLSNTNPAAVLTPTGPDYWLAPRAELPPEYLTFPSLKELMPFSSPGVKTSADAIFIAFTREELQAQIQTAGHHWNETFAQRVLYRPFDVRWLYYDPVLLGRPRPELARHMLGRKNISLIVMRQIVQSEITHFGICEGLCCHGTFYLGNKGQDYQFPLWLADGEQQPNMDLTQQPQHLQDAFAGPAGPMRFIAYVYAVFHATAYRQRYAAGLQRDFPRIPFNEPQSSLDKLCGLGRQLVDLHLSFQAGESPKESKATESEDGDTRILPGFPKHDGEAVWLNPTFSLAVSQHLWAMSIGGYPVCRKWLKDRAGQRLSSQELRTYRALLETLEATRCIGAEIDECLAGTSTFMSVGWPS